MGKLPYKAAAEQSAQESRWQPVNPENSAKHLTYASSPKLTRATEKGKKWGPPRSNRRARDSTATPGERGRTAAGKDPGSKVKVIRAKTKRCTRTTKRAERGPQKCRHIKCGNTTRNPVQDAGSEWDRLHARRGLQEPPNLQLTNVELT